MSRSVPALGRQIRDEVFVRNWPLKGGLLGWLESVVVPCLQHGSQRRDSLTAAGLLMLANGEKFTGPSEGWASVGRVGDVGAAV